MHFLSGRSSRILFLCTLFPLAACSWFAEDGEGDPTPLDGGGGFGGGFGGGVGGDTGGGGGSPTPRALGPLVTAEVPPPPIAGGTLYFSEATATLVASDPDRDAVAFIDAAATGTSVPFATVSLQPGDEPGRVSEAGGRFWVVLRSAGAVAAIDPADGFAVERFEVCPTPRGVAGDGDVVHVACESGDLVTLSAATGAEQRRIALAPDLRDVVVTEDGLYVSEFRRPAVSLLNDSGTTVSKITISPMSGFEPAVAYQMVAHPDGGVVVVHQYGNVSGVPIQSNPNAYGAAGCDAISLLGLARVDQGVLTVQSQLGAVTLPVSVAVDELGPVVIDAGAMNDGSLGPDFEPDDGVLESPFFDPLEIVAGSLCDQTARALFDGKSGVVDGRQFVAAVATPFGVFVQSRDPWRVLGPGVEITLPGSDPVDTGHDLFFSRAGAPVACATCHAEGGDDGLVWHFDGFLARRSHDLRGGILETAPFHWDGAHATFGSIMADTFETRMGGPSLETAYLDAIASYVDAIPMPPPPVDALDADALAGKAIFESETAACATCHAGPTFTNDATVDVGTGGAFQVPSLVGVSHRVRFLHDGCADDLEDAILGASCTPSVPVTHGDTSALSNAELDQLVAYLRSL